ncbi:unnamed protein product [Vitrella brassicaformis CCMP3155]|uniref:Uncharacterized protein n=1 Tax=Vitrella brassicaformis (strain CCMP3155) TaxID=1169540 RepID=A0A0G4EBR7_VITBC|nr:unnamed protein product [Vitrella brassicaformis CCMP3155]|eukprot:CEL93090.1 unnamed protein product [Vitrella brassicaformis CCMP3155]
MFTSTAPSTKPVSASRKRSPLADSKSTPFLSSVTGEQTKGLSHARTSYHTLFTSLEEEDLDPGTAYDDKLQDDLCLCRNINSWSRVIITRNHLSDLRCRDTPGAGKARRPPLSMPTDGPSKMYNVSAAALKFPCWTTCRFGAEKRFESLARERQAKSGNVGPGHYDISKSSFEDRLAKSFGVGRQAYEKVVTPGMDKAFKGSFGAGPGPPIYITPDPNSIRVSFTKAPKLRSGGFDASPGPGAYSSDITQSVSSLYRNSPVCSFGPPPSRARLNLRKMTQFENSVWGLSYRVFARQKASFPLQKRKSEPSSSAAAAASAAAPSPEDTESEGERSDDGWEADPVICDDNELLITAQVFADAVEGIKVDDTTIEPEKEVGELFDEYEMYVVSPGDYIPEEDMPSPTRLPGPQQQDPTPSTLPAHIPAPHQGQPVDRGVSPAGGEEACQ